MKSCGLLVLSTIALAPGCAASQSALGADGAPAIHLEQLIIGFTAVCFVVWILVMIALTWGLLRDRSVRGWQPSDRRLTLVVAIAAGATVVVISGLTIWSFLTTRSIGTPDAAGLAIVVRGKQWWWQIVYTDQDPSRSFETANEIHIPVGQDVRIVLEASDVIHSFWVPSLAGKQDMVPGRSNALLLRAERPGIYRGQCAEFCGLQHTHMAITVIAESPGIFEQWAATQRSHGVASEEPDAVAGKVSFLAKPCAACHTVRGTPAKGNTGPDLTHVAGRQMIAAGLLETTRGSLAAWIADPQTLKPGNNMPAVPLSSVELRNISAYMESLK